MSPILEAIQDLSRGLQSLPSSTPQATRPKKASQKTQPTAEDQRSQSSLSLSRGPSTTPVQKQKSPYPMPEARFQRKVMEMLVEMREDIRSLKSGLHAERGESTTISKSSTVEALDLLENRLDSLEEKQKLINGLSRIGGIHLKDNVKRIMEKLMSNDLMSQFNMKGGWGKLAFTKLRLFSVITESVLKTPGREEETEAKISEAVAFCLKYAPDRVGGGGRKSQMQQ
ncbi:uncharacterized protein LOC115568360 isoform X3 [Sparus aurata]|nr:uncharacterized protein LOC115568360 isoform X3 [Sparus aurata]XP_030251430.1 uncharacterized protein LOC115568360 isoform X3 [Sparus aurata]XP_030251431.1 uncharacterized protein LOC115568360 isoform X3 [Sparus aurata]XP_030251433.1 uncharacterized protein LOC115568360 isoform X3 [Sparus aurata]